MSESQTTEPSTIECHECGGDGGGCDYWGEWSDCACCQGEGAITRLHADEWDRDLAEMDAYCMRMMRCEGMEPRHAE